jgi:hypothetical protein
VTAGCSFLGWWRPSDAGVDVAARPSRTRPSTAASRRRSYRTSPLLVVQLGRDPRAGPGACSVYESESAGALAGCHGHAIGKHVRDLGAGGGVAPAFLLKRNSDLSGSRGPGPMTRRDASLAICETEVINGAKTCVRVSASTRNHRRRLDSLCPRAAVSRPQSGYQLAAALVQKGSGIGDRGGPPRRGPPLADFACACRRLGALVSAGPNSRTVVLLRHEVAPTGSPAPVWVTPEQDPFPGCPVWRHCARAACAAVTACLAAGNSLERISASS